LEFYKLVVKSTQYIVFRKQNMPKYFKFYLKKRCSNNFNFWPYAKKNLFSFFMFLFGKNQFFFKTKLPKISLKGVCQTHT